MKFLYSKKIARSNCLFFDDATEMIRIECIICCYIVFMFFPRKDGILITR